LVESGIFGTRPWSRIGGDRWLRAGDDAGDSGSQRQRAGALVLGDASQQGVEAGAGELPRERSGGGVVPGLKLGQSLGETTLRCTTEK
jgi:hypothetical protein